MSGLVRVVAAMGMYLALAPAADAQLRLGTGVTPDEKVYIPGGDAELLKDEAIQKDLDVTSEQMEKLVPVFRQTATLKRDLLMKQTRMPAAADKRDELWKSYNDAMAKPVIEVLTDGQRKRLEQVAYQAQGPEVFLRTEVRKRLRLTDEQAEGVKKLVIEIREETRKAPRETRERQWEQRQQYTEKALALLSDEQKGTWQTLIGKPFPPK